MVYIQYITVAGIFTQNYNTLDKHFGDMALHKTLF